MSQENIEKVRLSMEAYNRRDFDAALKDVHPDAVWEMSGSGAAATGTEHAGQDAVRRFWHDLEAHFQSLRLEPFDFEDLGDVVVCQVRVTGQGRGSGVAADASLYCVSSFRDGRVIRMTYVPTEREALEAAGRAHQR